MDRVLFSIVTLSLIYTTYSAPHFPIYPDYPYYRAHSPPYHPSQYQSPGYHYYQHPFVLAPYPDSYEIYNHLGPESQQKFPDYKPAAPDSKPTETETRSGGGETKKIHSKSASILNYARTPYIPNIQYIPIYGRNLDSWTAKEIPVTVIVDENFEKSYNVPYNTYQNPYVRNYIEPSKPTASSAEVASSDTGSVVVKSAATTEGHIINVHEAPIEQSQFIQGTPLIPNVASINTPQASITFYQAPYQPGSASYGAGRDLGSWNVNEIPISAVVVDEAVTDKNSENENKPTEEKSDSVSAVISSKN